MSKQKVITQAIAEKFLKNKNSVNLSEFTSIDDNAAQALAQHKGELWLNGLKTLSDAAAQALLCFNGVRLVCGEHSKKLLQSRRKHVLALIKAGGLKTPTEWQNGRIVLPEPPAKPLKGVGSKRTKAGEASWWLPKKVCNWFVQKLDDAHKTLAYGAGGLFGGKSAHISPEAAELLRSESVEWMWLMEEEEVATKQEEEEKLQSLGKLKVPKEFQQDRIVLPDPAKPLAKAYRWKANFKREDYQSVLHYYEYLPEKHVGSITDPDGYLAKVMSPEAAQLYRRHRAFWEAKHLEAKAQAKAASVSRRKAIDEKVSKAAAGAGMSRGQLKAKLDRLSELAAQDNLELACDMITGFEEAWLFEALLAGASVETDGTLKPGKELKRFKKNAEIIMLMCLAHLPEGAALDGSLSRSTKLLLNVNEQNWEVLGQICVTLKPLLPSLKTTGKLWLDGLTSLSDTAAQALAQHKEELDLRGLTSLSETPGHLALAEKLAQQEGCLDLRGLTSLSDTTAQTLAKHKGQLDLNGLRTLSNTAAQSLAKHKGKLSLGGLETLSDGVAQALAKHKGKLRFNGLRNLSNKAAQALAQHEGDLSLGDQFHGPRIPNLSDTAAQALGQHKGTLDLSSLESLSDTAAQALARHKGQLDLNGLKTLSDTAAQSLAKHKGKLSLGGLETLSDSAAQALAQHNGILILNGLTTLSDTAAQALGQHEGELWLYGLKSLSDTAAQALAKHKGQLSLNRLRPLMVKAAQALARHKGGLNLP